MGIEAPGLRILPDFALCMFYSECPSVTFVISFNKLANITVLLSSMRLYQINQTKEGVVGNWLVAFWSEIQIYKIQKYLDF